jgi:hypothetical protein
MDIMEGVDNMKVSVPTQSVSLFDIQYGHSSLNFWNGKRHFRNPKTSVSGFAREILEMGDPAHIRTEP